jgi:hypothetical protein
MSATFTKTGDWFGSIRAGYETANKVAGLPDPAPGYIWRRRIYTIDRARSGQQILTYVPNVGNTATGDDLCIVNGGDTVCGTSGDIYMLQKDDIVPTPQGSGMWQEQQIAVSYQEWEQWAIDTDPPEPEPPEEP